MLAGDQQLVWEEVAIDVDITDLNQVAFTLQLDTPVEQFPIHIGILGILLVSQRQTPMLIFCKGSKIVRIPLVTYALLKTAKLTTFPSLADCKE